jgi:hypothetical protein
LQFGALHDALGQLDEGLRLKQRALARDPFSPIVLLHIALSYLHQRRYDEALAWAAVPSRSTLATFSPRCSPRRSTGELEISTGSSPTTYERPRRVACH